MESFWNNWNGSIDFNLIADQRCVIAGTLLWELFANVFLFWNWDDEEQRKKREENEEKKEKEEEERGGEGGGGSWALCSLKLLPW